jgi:magnesium transporter
MREIQKNGVSWMDFGNPVTNDFLFLKDKFHLASLVVSELSTPLKRPKIEEHGDYLFLVLHFPVFDQQTRQTIPTELDFIITRKTIATVHQDSIPALEDFFTECLNNEWSQSQYFQKAAHLLFCILDKLIDSCLPMLDHVHDHIEEIENKVFHGQEKEMLSEVAIVKRDIIDFRRTIQPQRSVLEVLTQKANRFFEYDLDFISQEVIGSNIRVWNILENHKEMIEAIEKTNESLLSYQISEIVKILTIISFIAFPLNLVTGFLGMSIFENVPFAHSPFLYLIVLIVDILIVLLLVLFFRKKKWL